MLQTLRNNTKIILWVTIVAFVGLIVLVWGADLQVNQQDPSTIGKVNGQEVSARFFQQLLNEQRRAFRQQQDRELTFEDERLLSEQTWDLIVGQILISQSASEYDLPVTDDELVFWIRSNPPANAMQDPRLADASGNFDIQKYHESLRTEPANWIWYENQLRGRLPADKLQQVVMGSAKVSQAEVDSYVRDLAEQRVISFARIDPGTMEVDDSSITDDELQAFYDANPDEFTTGERARLRFVRIDKTASAEDEAALRADFDDYRREIQKDLNQNLEEGQTTFAALATSFSDGPQAESGGSWGAARQRERIRPPELAEQVFSTPVGELSEPFKANNRYYLVLVTEETPDTLRAFSVIERRLRAGGTQIGLLRDQVRQLALDARGNDLTTAAATAGFTVEETEPFTSAGFVPQLLGWREPVEFAFANDPGTVGGPEESEDAWIVYEVAERLDPEPYPFDQVKSTVRRRLIQEQQRGIAREQATVLAEKIESSGFEKGAKAAGIEIEQSGRISRRSPIGAIGNDPELTAAVFPLAVEQVSPLIETDTGFYVARADSVITSTPEEVENQRRSARMILEQNRQMMVFQSWLDDLKERAEIVDYRF